MQHDDALPSHHIVSNAFVRSHIYKHEHTMADATNKASSSASAQPSLPVQNKDLPSLGPLDEDDEFEEFEVQGGCPPAVE